ncbi:MarR family winged helix-turn-helix transcriptional regulator [Microlunatus soli]|uniref:Transcriptional regulator n=1 Tax=Microlunatus soli TaxID=630515 RepID=A0A1H1V4K9_9ACTN|nr:MarR family winged helix-turn-helix transcriptional regulator [Microlunatus soli]SDS79189.1 transcriptional regulator [Microlunatus soli]
MPGPPRQIPIGLRTTRSARVLERAFNEAMAAAGGSAPVWSILIACKSRGGWNQNELAASIGIRGATLTHHLSAMEDQQLISRRRDPDNRRVHIVELTEAGEQLFLRLRDVASDFDRRLRRGIPAADRETYERVLDTMINNVR